MKCALTFVTLAAACLFLGACSSGDPVQSLEHASILDEPRALAAFHLTDRHGHEFTQAQFAGSWSVLFAGFTHCPDICPATMAMLASAQKRAGISTDQLRTIFVSVDPERDTPAQLTEYLAHFNSEWTALTGEKEELDRLMTSLQMAYVRVPMGNGEYTMDHSTALVLIDPEGRMRGYFTAPLDVDALSEDLGRLAQVER